MAQGRFGDCLVFILKWEGAEFTNDPADKGGPTRYGITKRDYDEFLRSNGKLPQSVEFITLEEVHQIYTASYWSPVKAEETPSPLDLVCFDAATLMGVSRAISLLRSALKIPTGSASGIDYHSISDPVALSLSIISAREARYRAIVAADHTQARFLKGWLNRSNDLRQTVDPARRLLSIDRDGMVEFLKSIGITEIPETDAKGRAYDDPEATSDQS